MLRDRTLIPLSRQHHNGLALCVLSRRSLAADSSTANIARVTRRVIDHYEVELANHFEIEEQVLFPACGPMPVIDQLIEEHRTMERMIAELRSAGSTALMEEFFTLLTAHIRREERELFEEIQRAIPRDVLDQAGSEIEARVVRVCL